jgi:endonuclease III
VFRSIVVPKACFVLESLPTSEKRRAAAQSHARRSCSARQPSCDMCSVTFACLTWFE